MIMLDFVRLPCNGCAVFDAVTQTSDARRVAFHVAVQLHGGPLGFQRLDGALDDAALLVAGRVAGQRIAPFELLDAERNALALEVDAEHHGFHILPLRKLRTASSPGRFHDRSDR